MKVKEKQYDVAVAVARFQVPELTDAHRDLLNGLQKEHNRVILFLGNSPVVGTFRNPMDFQTRKRMVQKEYPDIDILYQMDSSSDEVWSRKLDEKIRDITNPNDTICLYGGRDSFIPHYSGGFDVRELESKAYVSGSVIRERAIKQVKSSADFRAGIVWATGNRYATSYQTVDVAVFDIEKNRFLLARKPEEEKLRFIGGFVNPSDDSLEAAAARELGEETGGSLSCGSSKEFKYLGSARINDWRYRREADKIMTAFFMAYYQFGSLKPSDDIAELHWVDSKNLTEDIVVDEHKILVKILQDKVKE